MKPFYFIAAILDQNSLANVTLYLNGTFQVELRISKIKNKQKISCWVWCTPHPQTVCSLHCSCTIFGLISRTEHLYCIMSEIIFNISKSLWSTKLQGSFFAFSFFGCNQTTCRTQAGESEKPFLFLWLSLCVCALQLDSEIPNCLYQQLFITSNSSFSSHKELVSFSKHNWKHSSHLFLCAISASLLQKTWKKTVRFVMRAVSSPASSNFEVIPWAGKANSGNSLMDLDDMTYSAASHSAPHLNLG